VYGRTISDRGLIYMPKLPDEYGSDEAIELSTSSALSGPHLWLSITQSWYREIDPTTGLFEGPEIPVIATAHITFDTARKLRDQLDYLLSEDPE
jgi:hypothetical protein